MAHIPYGYEIVNGRAQIKEKEAGNLKMFILFYLDGFSIKESKEKAGIPLCESTARKILSSPVYAGDDYYPEIIPAAIMRRIAEERQRRYEAMGSFTSDTSVRPVKVKEKFVVRKEKAAHISEPADRAGFIYGLICASEDGEKKISEADRKWIREYLEDNTAAAESDTSMDIDAHSDS